MWQKQAFCHSLNTVQPAFANPSTHLGVGGEQGEYGMEGNGHLVPLHVPVEKHWCTEKAFSNSLGQSLALQGSQPAQGKASCWDPPAHCMEHCTPSAVKHNTLWQPAALQKVRRYRKQNTHSYLSKFLRKQTRAASAKTPSGCHNLLLMNHTTVKPRSKKIMGMNKIWMRSNQMKYFSEGKGYSENCACEKPEATMKAYETVIL